MLKIRRPRWLRGTELALLRVRPGDVIVLTCPTVMSVEQVVKVGERAEQAWPEHKVVVLTNGVYVTAFRPEAGEV